MKERMTGRILIVGDQEDWRELLAVELDKEGHAIEAVVSFKEAVRELSQREFDLAILDVDLDDQDVDSAQSIELLREVEDRQPQTKVIILTRYPERVQSEPWREYRIDAVFAKEPKFDLEDLGELAWRLLREPRATHLQKIEIENIRSIKEIKWQPPPRMRAGWHVVIGDNGSGKSTFLRAVALALAGKSGAMALRQDWNDWLTRSEERGHIRLDLVGAPDVEMSFSRYGTYVELEQEERPISGKGAWNPETSFFSSAYGPFRRFSGGDQEYRRLFRSNPRLAAHLSVFGEDVALTEYLGWLQDLQFKSYEKDPGADLLTYVREFINQEGFLPHQARLHKITSEGVQFVDGGGHELPIEDLSDGYRCMLSMTFELIRQLAGFYGPDRVFDEEDPGKIGAPGIVLIDEIDAHLHPTWQRQVGLWFREHFPRMQFIVTTHSPLVCQAADVGTVYRLPRPGTDERPGMVTGIDLDRLLYGNVLDAYGTEVFGRGITRSAEARKRLKRLAELNLKELEKGLTDGERKDQQALRAAMPTSAYILGEPTEGER